MDNKKTFKSAIKLHSISSFDEFFLVFRSDYYIWNQFVPKKEKHINSHAELIKNKNQYKNILNMKARKYEGINGFDLLAGFLAILIFITSIVATTINYYSRETWTAIDELCRNEITYDPEFEKFEMLLDFRDDLSLLINDKYNEEVIEKAERLFMRKLLQLMVLITLIYIGMYQIIIRLNINSIYLHKNLIITNMLNSIPGLPILLLVMLKGGL